MREPVQITWDAPMRSTTKRVICAHGRLTADELYHVGSFAPALGAFQDGPGGTRGRAKRPRPTPSTTALTHWMPCGNVGNSMAMQSPMETGAAA